MEDLGEKVARRIQELDNEFIERIEKAYGFKFSDIFRAELEYELTFYSRKVIKLIDSGEQ